MATPNCLRCLPRSKPPANLLGFNQSLTRSFSASVKVAATPGAPARGEKTSIKIKKKFVKERTGKPPAEGERKAMRKRVVLSNTNALVVEGLRDLDKEWVGEVVDGRKKKVQKVAKVEGADGAVVDEGKGEGSEDSRLLGEMMKVEEERPANLVGNVIGLAGETVDSLRAVDAFKTTQGWGLFRRPGVLVREESVELTRKLVKAEREKGTVRLIVDGNRVTGKSLMLLHGMATAFVKGWIILNIPEAQELTTAATDYAPIPGTTPTQWSQPTYTANFLAQIQKANDTVLSKLNITKDHKLPIPIPEGITLSRLCELGSREPEFAWPIFQAFWSEITAAGRPPVMLCADSINFLMATSDYRDPEFNLIHSHDLVIVKHFIDYLSGSSILPNGGAVLGATNKSHGPISKSLELAVNNTWEKQNNLPLTPRNPWEKKYDSRSDEVLKNVEVMRLKGLSRVEARGLMEYWAKCGVLRSRVDEEVVAEKWALSGGGVVGELQRGSLWMRL